ncbi:MAG TPA: UDP-N-acetylmuramoyl-tripeptide--D-alanyl-D-alanine ligase [Candidatus Micrarchaeia archaeon]|nr:UDP-N-acetylmuramoyl-tripeptide--D-alanyl-D-alanine ligase [Candidatus Micrarchaeia archaeon]
MPLWSAAVLALAAGVAGAPRLRGWLYLLQLEEYLPGRLRATLWRRWLAAPRAPVLLAAGGGALAVAAARLPWPATSAAIAAMVAAGSVAWRSPERRGRLRWTARARRLAALAGALAVAWVLVAGWVGWPAVVLLGVPDGLATLALVGASAVLAPDEARRRRGYLRAASLRLQQVGPVVIGITGSYGKTSTKGHLCTLLDPGDGSVFATPASYNTTLGVCRAINDGLGPEHRVAIVEMGAYRPGEIAEICRLVRPRHGIVTSIGVMHLERFGSRRRIARAKAELFSALPPGGTAVAPSLVAERATLTQGLRARPVWVGAPGDDLWADPVEVTPQGTRFVVRDRDGLTLPLEAALFGRHTVGNLLCAIAVARACGVTWPAIEARCRHLRPAPHRLQVSTANGMTIIDDAYNANPDGAADALELLAQLPGVRRVLVTPGFIELGDEQEARMTELGRAAAAVCTDIVLVGPHHTRALSRGLDAAGFPRQRCTVVPDLDGAQRALPAIAGSGSVVLFENDLPDQYGEP